MSKHNFGIMNNKPMNEEKFDEYEPNKYNCISVDDDFIESILSELKNILLLQDKIEYKDLISLVNKAKEENKYIIHFGI